MQLNGNTILITGGASGIGFALAKRFIDAGSTVIVCGRRQEQLDQAKQLAPKIQTIQCDLSQEAERVRLFETVTKQFPKLNVLMNNAGIQNRPPPFIEPQDWKNHERELATNISAPVHLTLLFLRHLAKQESPKLINVTSGLAFAPVSFMPTYCMTKAALHSFTLSIRHQLKASPIEVIELIPPAVNTDLGGKGLHSHAVDLDLFADHCMKKLEAGEIEFGYESSEKRRLAVKEAIDPFFTVMNP